MNIAELLNNTKETLVSFEILPPVRGNNIQSIYNTLDPLMEFSPKYINVTYHREEITYKELKGGLLQPIVQRKRPGTVGITAAIKHKYSTEVVPHIICGGFSKQETEEALIDFNFLGINNVLIVRGDPLKSEIKFTEKKDGNKYAVDLVKQIANMNKGIFLNETVEQNAATNFCMGVAAYPEKHIESPNEYSDMEILKQKINSGAKYIVTQMFFDNNKYFDFVDKCRKAGIKVPIIPGIKPVSIIDHSTLLPKIFHIDIPKELTCEINKCNNNKSVRQVGIEWATQQSKELKKAGVPVIHYYTMGKADNIYNIVKNVF